MSSQVGKKGLVCDEIKMSRQRPTVLKKAGGSNEHDLTLTWCSGWQDRGRQYNTFRLSSRERSCSLCLGELSQAYLQHQSVVVKTFPLHAARANVRQKQFNEC